MFPDDYYNFFCFVADFYYLLKVLVFVHVLFCIFALIGSSSKVCMFKGYNIVRVCRV